jgi:hypothetical protein
MWDTESQKAAILRAIEIAETEGIAVVFDVADPFAVEREEWVVGGAIPHGCMAEQVPSGTDKASLKRLSPVATTSFATPSGLERLGRLSEVYRGQIDKSGPTRSVVI